ncbi:MAG: hypothetical protein ACK4QL_04580 [Pseudanabaenaceae cyanobacterium]
MTKINNIPNYGITQIEQRTRKSWDASIFNAVRQINRKNEQRKAGGIAWYRRF